MTEQDMKTMTRTAKRVISKAGANTEGIYVQKEWVFDKTHKPGGYFAWHINGHTLTKRSKKIISSIFTGIKKRLKKTIVAARLSELPIELGKY